MRDLVLLSLWLVLSVVSLPLIAVEKSEDFVEIRQLDDSIMIELPYATENNFCKTKLYPIERAFLRREVAEALVAAHRSLAVHGLGVKIWDGYRPHSVQYLMWEAAPLPGYVGSPRAGSKHNRGAAVDVTLYDLATGAEVEMPTPFDEFSPRARSHGHGAELKAEVANRLNLLQAAMQAQGFMTIPTEWWHFDFRGWERFPLANIPLETLAEAADQLAAAEAAHRAKFSWNWPRFRGPDASGIARESKAPLQWSARENIRWKVELRGSGSSSPIVWGGRVFVTSFSGYGVDSESTNPLDLIRHLHCLDLESGQLLWTVDEAATVAEDPYEGYLMEHGYASSTPATDGERVYCFFGKNGVVAYDFEGKRLWSTPTGTKTSKLIWGSAASVVLHEGLVYVNAGDEARALLALDAETGQERWRMEHDMMEQTYSTPVIQTLSAQRSDLVVASRGELRGLDPATGVVRWFSTSPVTGNLSNSPVPISENRLAVFGGFPRILGTVFTGGGAGDRSGEALVWESQKAKSYLPMPIEREGLLHWVSEDGIAMCVRVDDGEILYRERLNIASETGKGMAVYASPVLVGDHLIAMSRSAGAFVIETGPEFQLFGVNQIEDDSSRFNATPAVAGDVLLLRSEKAIYAIGR